MLNIQTYKKVESLDEAYELNKKKANRIIGGMMWMRMGETRIQTAKNGWKNKKYICLRKVQLSFTPDK